MNVLYVHDRPSGGAGESLYQLVRGRSGRGRSALFFGQGGFVGGRFNALDLQPAPVTSYMRPWLYYRPERPGAAAWLRLAGAAAAHAVSFARLVALARRSAAEIVHTNCIYLADGAAVARLFGLPHVWQVRELLDLDYYDYPIDKRRLVGVLQRFSTVVLCNSHRTARGLERLGADPGRLRVIHNVVDPPRARADLRARLGLPPGVKLVGYVGWITPNKRVEDFLEVAERLADRRDLKFVIIGGWGGKPGYDERIKALLAARANVIHAGIIDDAPDHMASLDLLLCPCYTESFGRTVGEALAAGVPAIGVRDSAVAELIDDGESGHLVDRADTLAMAAHVRALIADEPRRRRFGERGRAAMAARFSSEVLVPEYEALYQELTARA